MRLICYLSNGFPTIDDGLRMADHYIASGCDCIEIDLPAREPYLEGQLIASRMKAALAACDDYGRYLEAIAAVRRKHPGVKVLLLSYEATIQEIGVERFAAFCAEHDLRDLIVVGKGDDDLRRGLLGKGLRISRYVQFHMPEAEIAAALESNGFVYMQAVPVAGNIDPRHPTLKSCIARLRERGIDREIYCGVGVYTEEDVAMVRSAGGDGVFIGSAILKHYPDQQKIGDVIGSFSRAAGRRT